MNIETLLGNGSEHGHQRALFAWAAIAHRCGFEFADAWARDQPTGGIAHKPVDALRWLHAIPSGGSRGDTPRSRAIVGGRMKAEGVRKGIADIFLPVPTNYHAGLYIEMKKEGGRITPEQKAFGSYCKRVGYGWVVCYSWREAADIITTYESGRVVL